MGSVVNYPNDRTNPEGAIPVFIVGGPVGGAIPINIFAGPVGVNSGPVPIRVVAGPGLAGGSDQGIDANAIPVYESAAPNAMPVWNVAPAIEIIPPEIDVPPFITPTGIVTSGTVLTLNPGDWLNEPTDYIYQWTRNGTSIGGAIGQTYTTTVGDRGTNIGGFVIAENEGGQSISENATNSVSVMGLPVNVIAPVISPAGPVVSGTELVMNNGTWTNMPTSYYYGWQRNSIAINGANFNTYLTTTDDEDTTISGVLQASNAAGGGVAVASNNTVSVTAPEEP